MADTAGNVPLAGQRMTASTATITWAVLVAATLLGWFFAQAGSGDSARLAIVIIAGIKIYLVVAVFMGLWRAPRNWHAAAIAWIALTFGLVYLLATGGAP